MCVEQKEIDELKSKLNRIIFHFESDTTMSHKGLPERMEHMENSLRGLEDDKKILKGVQIAFGVAGGIIAFIFSVLGKFLLSHINK